MTKSSSRSSFSTTAVLLAAFVCVLGVAVPARAQVSAARFFLDLHGAAQLTSNDFDTETSLPLYNETAHVRTRQEIGNAAMFDLRLGYRINDTFGVAVSFSGAETKYVGSVAASIPDPVVNNRDKAVQQDVTDMARRELGYHLQVLYFLPVTQVFDLTFAIGPSFVTVQQPVIAVAVIPGTQNLDVSVPKDKETIPAFNVGVDATYNITPRFGASLFVRYLNGTKNFEDIDGVSVNGVQIGVGVRVGF